MNVKKAIFPVGGLGTRFLPATKSMPKEMLPIVDKPLIQYAVEEAANAGIEQFIFVTSRGKSAIENHFDHSFELENNLLAKGKRQTLACRFPYLLFGEVYQPNRYQHKRGKWNKHRLLHNQLQCLEYRCHEHPPSLLAHLLHRQRVRSH